MDDWQKGIAALAVLTILAVLVNAFWPGPWVWLSWLGLLIVVVAQFSGSNRERPE